MKVKDSREAKYLKSLPPQLANNPFWASNHVTYPPSFGAQPRDVNVFPVDDPYIIEKRIDQWERIDKNYSIHGRIPVESTWGTQKYPPSCVKYDPNHELLSRRENEPAISILDKHNQKDQEYYESVQQAQSFKPTDLLLHMETKQLNNARTFLKKSSNITMLKDVAKQRKPVSELQKVNIDDMRKSLLPGPGSYQIAERLLDRFERDPRAILCPRQPVAKARPVLNKDTLQLRGDDVTLIQSIGSYSPNPDVVHRHYPAYTLGEKRPIRSQKQELTPGPGDYAEEQAVQIGQPRLITSSTDLLQSMKPIAMMPTKYFPTSKHRRKKMF